jgi:hypothetical protein
MCCGCHYHAFIPHGAHLVSFFFLERAAVLSAEWGVAALYSSGGGDGTYHIKRRPKLSVEPFVRLYIKPKNISDTAETAKI